MAKITKVYATGKGFGPRGDATLSIEMEFDGFDSRVATMTNKAIQEEWHKTYQALIDSGVPEPKMCFYNHSITSPTVTCIYEPRYNDATNPVLKFSDPKSVVAYTLAYGKLIETWFAEAKKLYPIVEDIKAECHTSSVYVGWDSEAKRWAITVHLGYHNIPTDMNPGFTCNVEDKFYFAPEELADWRRSDAVEIWKKMYAMFIEYGRVSKALSKIKKTWESLNIYNFQYDNRWGKEDACKYVVFSDNHWDGEKWADKKKEFFYKTAEDAERLAEELTAEYMMNLVEEWDLLPKPKPKYVPTSTEEIEELKEERAAKKQIAEAKKKIDLEWAELQGQLKALTQTP